METKQMIRKAVKAKLANIQKPEYEDKSYQIAQTLFSDPYWKDAKTVAITVSNPPEADTLQIIRKGWELGKKIAVPKCIPESKGMVFRTLTRFSELESSFFNLYEPIEGLTEAVSANEIDLMIVPGVAFTYDCYRIGHGGGYYDRYLTNFNGKTVSLAFEEQLIDRFQVEEHDIPVMKLITDKKVIELNRGKRF
ncbi:5-formyltetrahydrofolate cyclo-ligase [Bacillus methanolicus PB1]|uniref:5-formyltetrahydrofolate cyclo-ligase n=1 Tax=Bacillus methanolicus PB1 TaxID=997296 RepID=I3DX94_BACMT|nr:5-formyltetrahydrofolate cyclo-ligase [Bacillus methanolicus]EIJ78865.1 5-formyltetrahydrofolate cyclo-ligase [Bacillus methanolicus PB1]